jgi:hypothetical protein
MRTLTDLTRRFITGEFNRYIFNQSSLRVAFFFLDRDLPFPNVQSFSRLPMSGIGNMPKCQFCQSGVFHFAFRRLMTRHKVVQWMDH